MIGAFAHFQCILFFFGKTFTLAYIGEPDGDCEISSNAFIFCCEKIGSSTRGPFKCYSRGMKEFFHLLVTAA